MRIAVLDDDRLLLEMMERVIQEMGNTCQLYETGQACLQDLRRETFDMLIVDWELPDTSGPEVIRWARQHLDASFPILFITHRSEERDIVEGLQCGADDFMTKPVRVAELKARMHALLRRAYPQWPGTGGRLCAPGTRPKHHRTAYAGGAGLHHRPGAG